ncbi:hypothetical protein G6F35_018353 [Rhizopus arrhizus]|nr:hypothetical protein G6F35_018353 [Rhizopus arrhizus]
MPAAAGQCPRRGRSGLQVEGRQWRDPVLGDPARGQEIRDPRAGPQPTGHGRYRDPGRAGAGAVQHRPRQPGPAGGVRPGDAGHQWRRQARYRADPGAAHGAEGAGRRGHQGLLPNTVRVSAGLRPAPADARAT